MLVEWSIRNLAVIESVKVSCSRGFHVLTGETGAGKSILLDALSLIAGGRGSTEFIRHGCEKAEIECCFDMPEFHPIWELLKGYGIEASKDEYLVIRRELTLQGKSMSRINGQLVNLTTLKEIGEWLINIHGQHEHQSLLKAEHHLVWLDDFSGKKLNQLKQQYQTTYFQHKAKLKELNSLETNTKQHLQMLDLYRFQMEEIESAGLKLGEDELLSEEKQKLANAEKMFQASAQAYDDLIGEQDGIGAVSKAIESIEQIASFDTNVLEPLLEQLQTAYYQIEDATHQLRNYRDQIEFNPSRLDEIESRLNLISSLRRKYGSTIQEILDHLSKIKNEIEAFENKDEKINQLRIDSDTLHKELIQQASKLTSERKKASTLLSKRIESELKDLHMERTRFEVNIEASPSFTEAGKDLVEFMISANPGEPLKSLSKVASGGELSRIMLALKAIFAVIDQIPVLVFDEVDTGVSGRAAQAIAEKMARLSNECQVFSITHLPQVACMADVHYAIYKQVNKQKTFTEVNQLIEKDKVTELARMLSGVQITETTEHHAEEMLDMAKQKKQQWNHLQ